MFTAKQRRWHRLLVGTLTAATTFGLVFWWAFARPLLASYVLETTGLRVELGALYPSWRDGTLVAVARDVTVFGRAPFASEPLASIERLEVTQGGAAAVTIEGLVLTLLVAPQADNLRGYRGSPPRPRAAPAVAARSGSLWRREVKVVSGRATALIQLPGGRRLAMRSKGLRISAAGEQVEATLEAVTADLAGVATAQLGLLSVEATLGHELLLRGEDLDVRLPGAAPLLRGLRLDASARDDGFSLDVRPAQADALASALGLHARRGARGLSLEVRGDALPLAGLAPWLDGRGLGVDRATTSFMLAADKAPGDEGLTWRFEGQVQEISLHHPDLDRQSWQDVRLEAASQGRFFPRQSRWQIDAGRFGFPGLPVAVTGFVQGGEAPSGSLSFQVSDWPCSDLVGHAPGSLRGALWGLALEGRLAAAMDVTFDAADWEKLALDVRFPSLCHVTRDPEPLAADLSPLQTGAAPVSTRSDLPLSPRQPGFTPLQSIPPHVRAAFLTAEDAGFFLHHGFEPEHMRRALVHNLERGRLARGASTITQQVAKNLFLSHERTLARKLAEAVLTWRLDALVPKPRMLELYLNLVELGPGIHGVGEAARVYFGKAPEALTPLEAAHLASLPPNPRGFARRFRDGSVDEGWLARLYDLVGIMGRRGHLSPADVAAARGAKLQLRKI